MIVFWAVLSAIAAVPLPAGATVYVSEFLASNSSSITDEDAEFSDWIEIYNANTAAVDLGGWYLTDDAASSTKWQFPATVVPGGGYLVVFASDKNRAVAGAELHTNFKLGASGEYLALVRNDGTTIEHEYAPAFPAQSADVTWGVSVDLSQQRCFLDPTPGAVNDETPSCGVVEAVDFSVERGFYATPFTVSLSTPTAGAVIYYTLDGSAPGPTNGAVYGSPISITTTTAVRAVAVAPGLLPAASMTHSYLFLDDVIRQTGAGFPTEGFDADYAMDPKVVDDPRYAATIVDDLRAVPTISVVMDVEDLFGLEDGIYTHPSKRGEEWERPASAELILPDGSTGFQINCGTRIQGRLSRVKNRKKSLRLAFKSAYGPPALDYPMFPDTPVTRFNKLRLRASHNKSWSFGIQRADYIRDQWTRDTQIDMGHVASHGGFFQVYLNGLYWGLYNVVELPEAEFAAAYYGGLEEEWDVLEPAEVEDGNRDAWKAAHDIAVAGVETPAAYEALRQYVDVPNLIDYMLVNFHAGTLDWDDANWYAGRRRLPGEGFKFFGWDAEQSMEIVTANRMGIHHPSMPSAFHYALRANPEYRVLFGDHAHRHFFRDGALVPRVASERYMERVKEIDRAIVAESARWGDSSKQFDPFDRDTDWLREIEWLRVAYFPRRSGIVLSQLRDVGLYPPIDAPVLSVPGRFYPIGTSLALTAASGSIYYTLDGTDPRLTGGAIAPTASTYSAPLPLSGAVQVRARARDGGVWSALSEAVLTPDIPLRVTEMMYHPPDPGVGSPYEDDDFEFLEVANVGSAPLALAGIRVTEGIDFEFPATTLLPGARALVVRDQAGFESRYGAGLPILGEYGGKLANEGERIRIENDDGEVLDFTYDDAWHPDSDGDDRSLVIVDATADRRAWSRAEGWRTGVPAGGTPGAPEPALCADGVDNDGDGAIDLADLHCEAASDDAEAAPPIDAFVCYSVSVEQEDPGLNVTLADEIDAARSFNLDGSDVMCIPAVVESDALVIDAATRLQGFRLRSTGGADSPELTGVLAAGLGPVYLDTFQPDRLLAPAALGEGAPVPAPADDAHALDYYKCHRVKKAKSSPEYFPRQVKLRARDALEDRSYDFRRPNRLCYPTSADGRGLKNPAGKLVCYQARRSRESSKHVPLFGLHLASPLGAAQVTTRDVTDICIPGE